MGLIGLLTSLTKMTLKQQTRPRGATGGPGAGCCCWASVNKVKEEVQEVGLKGLNILQGNPKFVRFSTLCGIFVSLILGILIGMLLQARVIPAYFGHKVDIKISESAQSIEKAVDAWPTAAGNEEKLLQQSELQQLSLTKKQTKRDVEDKDDLVEVKLEDVDSKTRHEVEDGSQPTGIGKEEISSKANKPIQSMKGTKRQETKVSNKGGGRKNQDHEKGDRKIEDRRSSEDSITKTVTRTPSDAVKAHSKSKVDVIKSTGPNKLFDIEKGVKDFKVSLLNQFTPKKIFQDGRRIPPVMLHHTKENNSTVRAYLFEEFFSKVECDGLMKAHDNHVTKTGKQDPLVCFHSIMTLRSHLKELKKSRVKVSPKDFTEGTTCLNATFSTQFKEWSKSNWSYSTAFYPGESRFTALFDQRVERATGLREENGGKFQITSYPVGIGYKTHTDCRQTSDKRDRFATVLVYLQDVEEGGETKFPELGIWVKPKKGRALVWTNMNEKGDCEPESVHFAAKVTKGHKYILQRWYYYENFYSLGKRPPEPHLPPHNPGQPMVSCDEYENGSCRWYDEWNYDHILDYRNQKINLI